MKVFILKYYPSVPFPALSQNASNQIDVYASVRQDIDCYSLGSQIRFRENTLYSKISRKKLACYLITLQGDPIFRKSHSHIEFPSNWIVQKHQRLYISQLLTEVDSENGLSRYPLQFPCNIWVQFKTLLPFPTLPLQWRLQIRQCQPIWCAHARLIQKWVTQERGRICGMGFVGLDHGRSRMALDPEAI